MAARILGTAAAVLLLAGCGHEAAPPAGTAGRLDRSSADAPRQTRGAFERNAERSEPDWLLEGPPFRGPDNATPAAPYRQSPPPARTEALPLFALAESRHREARRLHATDRQAANQQYLEAAEYIDQSCSLDPTLISVNQSVVLEILYDAIRAHAAAHDTNNALKRLAQAFDAGFANLAAVQRDAELQTLRSDPDFQQLVSEKRRMLVEQARRSANRLMAQHQGFDFSFALPDTKGERHSLDDYQGKLLVVEFWGTWCVQCRDEIPCLVMLYDKYRQAGLEIVGINYERGPLETWASLIEAAAAASKIAYPCLIGDEATKAQLPDYRTCPTTLFIDRAGTVRLKLEGYRSAEQLEGAFLELLAEDSRDNQPTTEQEQQR